MGQPQFGPRMWRKAVKAYLPERWDYYQICAAHDDQGDLDSQLAKLSATLEPSVEYGASIVNAVVTGTPAVVYRNVPNATGLISNLPPEACVEVPCLVDTTASSPPRSVRCRSSWQRSMHQHRRVQTLAVQAALTGDRDNVHHAVAVDPLTSAMCTLREARAMTEQLFEGHRDLLPAELLD